MDISRYHTKYPPPEHEEAVRMLLEGLDKQTSQGDLNNKQSQALTRKPRNGQPSQADQVKPRAREERSHNTPKSKTISSGVKYLTTIDDNHQASPASSSVDSGSMARGPSEEEEDDDDDDDDEEDEAYEFSNENHLRRRELVSNAKETNDLEFNSEESSSREFTNRVTTKRIHLASLPKMHSKATSTASDTMSTSGASSSGHNRAANELTDEQNDDMNANCYETIPSRTIAIQCDLKLSSVKRDGYLDSASTDLASMQASSISSTRYGFYRLSPETLEQRRQLARSVSSRNIAQHGGVAQSPSANANLNLNVVEAPTSMSELSSEDEPEEVGGFDRELAKVVRRNTSAGQRSADEDDLEPPATSRLRRDDRFLSQRQLHQHLDRSGASRARRQDSLPRRPKTALSYVSTSRLRDNEHDDDHDHDGKHARSVRGSAGEQTPDKSLSDHELEGPVQCSMPMTRRMTPRNRALSQQVLSSSQTTGQPRQRVSALRRSRANEPEQMTEFNHQVDSASLSNSDSELQNGERFGLAQQEEVVVATKRGRPAMGASPQVRRSNNIRNGPLVRRYATLTTPNATTIDKENDGLANGNHHLGDREMFASGQQRRQRNNMASYKLSSVVAGTTTNYSTTTDEENQSLGVAAAAETRRQRAAASLADQPEQPKARFSSLSLSRRQPLIGNVEQTSGSCNLINPTTRARPRMATTTKANTVAAHSEPAHLSHQETNYQHRHNQRSTLARADRLNNHQGAPAPTTSDRAQIGRSASMKQGRTRLVAATGEYERPAPVYTTPDGQTSHRQRNYYDPGTQCEYDDCCGPSIAGDLDEGYLLDEQELRGPVARTSESPATRTWANPSSARRHADQSSHHQSVYNLSNEGPGRDYRRPSYPQTPVQTLAGGGRPLTRKSVRSHSMRDVNQIEATTNNAHLIPGIHSRPRRFERIYHAGQEQLDQEDDDLVARQHPQPDDEVPSEEVSVCSSSSINGATREALTRAQANHQPLDFDSQQRLNEIGLPAEPGDSVAASPNTKRASASHLGLSAGLSNAANRYATTGRSPQQVGPTLITGRAMSQQSLTRPTMPLSRRLRRSGGGGGVSAGSGSDVGGSSMSLVSRLRDGSRYENAHTRTPVVMLIPQATPSSNLSRSESNSRRASSRLGRPLGKTSGLRVSSQDRASHRRSTSRNNSDSESSSSMLRTLVKPRINRIGSTNRSARRSKQVYGGHTTTRNDSDLEENMDGVGQLATEIDSYKFRRRYSVPKDAKINWFSKLKQRVTSKN